ncbi:alpha-amylase-like [Aethina tumida]|uniref:alpha-amylase-like n=1 Tax=Aethina tumida TaxID=116153 RepID=UPI0021486C32|nr:alpha-amylase-like [Aethina tumida]
MMNSVKIVILCTLFAFVTSQKDPHFADDRSVIVHLFEWKWSDIADECERYLGPKGFGGVQISPPNENLVISSSNRPWWERYQPVSYILNTRSGDEAALADMISRCNAVDVRIYVDAVINHMAAGSGTGTAGSSSDADNKKFPGVSYGSDDFHASCRIDNYQDAENVRNCELEGLKDLDQSHAYVRQKIVEYMNHLIDLGVAGFRVDAAKHMWPADLEAIYGQLEDTQFGGKPFIYQEVIDLGGEAIKKEEYTGFGTVLEFLFGTKLGDAFQGNNKLTYLENWGPEWGLLDGLSATVFIDNHDNQRTGSSSILTYKNPKPYKMALAFMLAHPYGTTRIMSSYAFDDKDQPPPQDENQNIISPGINDDETCSNGWVCEHRWRQIANMVVFRNTVLGTEINHWWSNGDNQIAFGRGEKGFIAFTNGGDINENLSTLLPDGSYCDIITGNLENGSCTGKMVTVSGGQVSVSLRQDEEDGVMAIHLGAKL